MKILMTGDIVGSPGRRAFAQVATRIRQQQAIDLVVANAENAAGGNGLTPRLAEELFTAGADILTLGDHCWDQKELIPYVDVEPRVLRPANLVPSCPGRGWYTHETPVGNVTIINLLGRVFMPPMDDPFRCIDAILERPDNLGAFVLVDFHAEATSEKIAMGWHLDGRVSAVVGTHTHVQTSDARVLPKGTAYLTDLGMTGPRDSVLGRDIDSVMKRFLTGMPSRFTVASGDIVFEGAIVTLDDSTGKASGIEIIREVIPCEN